MKRFQFVVLAFIFTLPVFSQDIKKMTFLKDTVVKFNESNRPFNLKIQKNESFFVKLVKDDKYVFIQPDTVTRAITKDQKIETLSVEQKNFTTFELHNLLKFDTITRKNVNVSFPSIKDKYHLGKLVINSEQNGRIALIKNSNSFPIPKSSLLFVLKIDTWPSFIIILDTTANKKSQVKPAVVQKANPPFYDDSVTVMSSFTKNKLSECDASPGKIKDYCAENGLQVPDTIINKIAVARKYSAKQCSDSRLFIYILIFVFVLLIVVGFLAIRFKFFTKIKNWILERKTPLQSEFIQEKFEHASLFIFLKAMKEKHYKSDVKVKNENAVLLIFIDLNKDKIKKLLLKCNPTFKIENLGTSTTSTTLPYITHFQNKMFNIKEKPKVYTLPQDIPSDDSGNKGNEFSIEDDFDHLKTNIETIKTNIAKNINEIQDNLSTVFPTLSKNLSGIKVKYSNQIAVTSKQLKDSELEISNYINELTKYEAIEFLDFGQLQDFAKKCCMLLTKCKSISDSFITLNGIFIETLFPDYIQQKIKDLERFKEKYENWLSVMTQIRDEGKLFPGNVILLTEKLERGYSWKNSKNFGNELPTSFLNTFFFDYITPILNVCQFFKHFSKFKVSLTVSLTDEKRFEDVFTMSIEEIYNLILQIGLNIHDAEIFEPFKTDSEIYIEESVRTDIRKYSFKELPKSDQIKEVIQFGFEQSKESGLNINYTIIGLKGQTKYALG